MPTTYKVLAQSAPTLNVDTPMYTVPAGTQAVVSTISVANRSSTASTFRIAVRPGGAPLSNEHYVAFDTEIIGNTTTAFTLGITLSATDIVAVRANSSNLSFIIFGSEIT